MLGATWQPHLMQAKPNYPQVHATQARDRTITRTEREACNVSNEPESRYHQTRSNTQFPRLSMTPRERAILVTCGVFMIFALLETTLLAAEYARETPEVRRGRTKFTLSY